MFKNPLKKYQAGGSAPSQEQQEMLAAFVEWLPKRVEEFANMAPEQIIEALNGMSKTPEGQKQVEAYMQQFQQEMQNPQAGMFKDGGKLHDFICKHAKGGHVAGCGCGGKVEKHQQANGEGRGVIGESIWGPIIGNRRDFFHYPPESGFAGSVDMKTGRAYKAETNEEMAQPGMYNAKGYPIYEGQTTNGTYYEVNPHGRIIVNIPEGGQRVLHGADSVGVVNLINQWDQTKVGHAVKAKSKGGIVKDQEPAGPLPTPPQVGITYGATYKPIGENQATYQDGEYVTTKEEPLLGKRYVGWRRTVIPGTTRLASSDMYGGTPENMSATFNRYNNGNTILDVIETLSEDGHPNALNSIVQRIINTERADTSYWPSREMFFEKLKSKGTYANGRPNWIILDTERNKNK